MTRSRQANILVLPTEKAHLAQTKTLSVTTQSPPRPDPPQIIVSPRLRFLPFFHPKSDTHLTFIMPRDHVRWGSILAGFLTAIVTHIGLSLLGLVISVIALPPSGDTIATNITCYAPVAMIWEAGSMALSVFLGGFVAAKSAAVGGRSAAFLNGALVFVVGIVLSIGLVGIGIGLLFNSLGTDPVNLFVFGLSAINDPRVADTAVDQLKQIIMWALAALVIGMATSGLGGIVGHQKAPDA